MEPFKNLIGFVRDIEDRLIFETLEQVFNQFGFVVKDFIINKQSFREGIDGTGERIKNRQTGSTSYARTTIRIKISKGQPVDRITLHDSERFVDSITIEGKPDSLVISSNVVYDKYIFKKYGKDVIRPTAENLIEFVEKFYIPRLRQRVQNQLKQ